MRPELHIACAAFPALPEEDLAALAADIRAKGLLEPITLTLDGLLLDGRCRWDACERVGIEPRTVVYDGDDPVGFVASKNRHRRHLSNSQLGIIMARLATLPRGRPNLNSFTETIYFQAEANTSKTRTDLAKLSGVSESTIGFAKRILTQGAPNVIAMVDNGQVRAMVAAEAVKGHDRTTQSTWTLNDVKKIGMEIINNYPSNQSKTSTNKQAKSKSKPRPIINPPYLKMEWPTKEELDYPKEGSSVEEFDAFFAKYGRTPLHPKAIKEMLDADSLSSRLANAVRTMTHSSHPDPEQFFAYLDHLATHRRESGKTNGAQIDFANRGRATLAMLEAALPKALELLHELQDKLAARQTTRVLHSESA